MQAIETRYLGPTNTRGSRIKATAAAGSITIHYDDALNSDENHKRAAIALAQKYGWEGRLVEGGSPGGSGNVYVFMPHRGSETIRIPSKRHGDARRSRPARRRSRR